MINPYQSNSDEYAIVNELFVTRQLISSTMLENKYLCDSNFVWEVLRQVGAIWVIRIGGENFYQYAPYAPSPIRFVQVRTTETVI